MGKGKRPLKSEHGNTAVGGRGLKEESVCGPRDKGKERCVLVGLGSYN